MWSGWGGWGVIEKWGWSERERGGNRYLRPGEELSVSVCHCIALCVCVCVFVRAHRVIGVKRLDNF